MIFFRTSTPYDLSLYQVGYEKCSENHFFGPVIRDFYVLHFVVSGKGTYRVREKNIPLQKGDCFLVIPNEPTYYEADHSDPYEYYWIGFHGTNSKKLMISLGFYTDDNFIFHCDGSVYEDMLSYMQELKSLYEPDEKTYLFCLGRLYEVLSLMKKNTPMDTGLRGDENLWKQICEYVAINYAHTLSVGLLSEKFNLHRSGLYKLFERNSGLSPSEYILNYRLEKALFLVKNSDLLYKSIAFECGFSDVTQFYRCFKKKYKKTPRQMKALD